MLVTLQRGLLVARNSLASWPGERIDIFEIEQFVALNSTNWVGSAPTPQDSGDGHGESL